MRTFYSLGLLLALLYNSCYANAPQISVLNTGSTAAIVPVEQAFMLSLTHTQDTIKANWLINDCCYLYQNQMAISAITNQQPEIKLIDTKELPPAIVVDDPFFGAQSIYKKQLDINLALKKVVQDAKNDPVYLHIAYQGCAQSGFCYPPQDQWYEVKIKAQQIASVKLLEQAPTLTVTVDPNSNSLITLEGRSFLAVIATFYFLGILLTFTPCVLPMLPILGSVIVGQDHLNTRKAFWISLCYVLSMAVTYAVIGIIAALVGKNLQALMQKPLLIIGFAALFVYLAFVQLGKIHFSPFKPIKDWLHHHHLKQEGGSYVGAIMMGILATLIASPCVTAPLIGALSYISQTGDVILGGSALLALGLGMGTLLLVVGTLGGKYIPKAGSWMHAVNQAFAVVMFGLSIALISRVFTGGWVMLLWAALCIYVAYCLGFFKRKAKWASRLGIVFVLYAVALTWGAFMGEKDPLQPLLSYSPWKYHKQEAAFDATFIPVDSIATLEKVQLQAQKAKKPLLLVFYADWCISCKHIEHELFNASNAIHELNAWMLARADVTAYNKNDQALLQKFALMGPPAILFFDEKGNELTKYRVVGETSRKKFMEDLNSACIEIQRK